MTLSGTWCGGSDVRFMSAVESVENRRTKTALESFRCDGLLKFNIDNRVGQGGARFRIPEWLATEFELRCVTILPPQRRVFQVPERADPAPSASGSLAGISANSRGAR